MDKKFNDQFEFSLDKKLFEKTSAEFDSEHGTRLSLPDSKFSYALTSNNDGQLFISCSLHDFSRLKDIDLEEKFILDGVVDDTNPVMELDFTIELSDEAMLRVLGNLFKRFNKMKSVLESLK